MLQLQPLPQGFLSTPSFLQGAVSCARLGFPPPLSNILSDPTCHIWATCMNIPRSHRHCGTKHRLVNQWTFCPTLLPLLMAEVTSRWWYMFLWRYGLIIYNGVFIKPLHCSWRSKWPLWINQSWKITWSKFSISGPNPAFNPRPLA